MRAVRAAALLWLMLSTPAFAAEDPLTHAGELLVAGRVNEAREQVLKFRDVSAARSNASGEAAAWLLLGIIDSAQQDLAAARTDLDRAAAMFQALDDPFGAWLSLFTLAELERSSGHFDEAVALHERIVPFLRAAAGPEARFSIESMKVVALAFGAPAANVTLLDNSPELVKSVLLQSLGILSRDAYAGALMDVGELKKAEEQLGEAAAAPFGGMFDFTIAAHLGDLRRLQWRLEEARAQYLKALDSAKQPLMLGSRDPVLEIGILGKLAELDALSGRLEEALAWNDRALELVRGTSAPGRVARVLHARADLLLQGGRSDPAGAALEEALKIATAAADQPGMAEIDMDLAMLHTTQGSYGTAVKDLEKAIALYQALRAPERESVVWVMLAEAHLGLGAYDSATVDLDHARALAKKSSFKIGEALADMVTAQKKVVSGGAYGGDVEEALDQWWSLPEIKDLFRPEAQQVFNDSLRFHTAVAAPVDPARVAGPPIFRQTALAMQGRSLLARGDSAAARKIWEQLLAENPSRDHRAALLGAVGVTYWKEGKRDEAIRSFKQAADAFDASAADVKVEDLLAGYLGSYRKTYYEMLIEMMSVEGHGLEAFAQAERARARAFLEMVGNHRFNAARGADPQLVREADVLRAQIAGCERAVAQAQGSEARKLAAELEGAQLRYRSLMTRVKVSNPEYAALANVEPLPVEGVQTELPDDTTLISYFVSANAVHAWVVDRTAAHYALLPVDAATRRRIVCWAEQFGASDMRGVVIDDEPCREPAEPEEVFDRLFAPLAKDVHTRRLMIVPHGVLHYVPFAALRNRDTGHYLVEDYVILYAPSASVLHFLRSKETPVDGGSLVLGDPVSPLPSLKKLPGARQEAATVARMLGTSPLLGAEAREALLYHLGGKTDLVHLAAHGIYARANPLFSRVALAAGDDADGSLTVDEILSTLDLSGVNLVVLSACRSASGARSGGDDVVGLARALLYAGTPGVISTLWNIDDVASAGLMEEFYRRLTEGAPVAEALRQAQITVMHRDEYQHPKYWAAFMLTGDPQGRWKRAAPAGE